MALIEHMQVQTARDKVPKLYFYEGGIAGRGKMVLSVLWDMHVSSEILIRYALGLIDSLLYHAHSGSSGCSFPSLRHMP